VACPSSSLAAATEQDAVQLEVAVGVDMENGGQPLEVAAVVARGAGVDPQAGVDAVEKGDVVVARDQDVGAQAFDEGARLSCGAAGRAADVQGGQVAGSDADLGPFGEIPVLFAIDVAAHGRGRSEGAQGLEAARLPDVAGVNDVVDVGEDPL